MTGMDDFMELRALRLSVVVRDARKSRMLATIIEASQASIQQKPENRSHTNTWPRRGYDKPWQHDMYSIPGFDCIAVLLFVWTRESFEILWKFLTVVKFECPASRLRTHAISITPDCFKHLYLRRLEECSCGPCSTL